MFFGDSVDMYNNIKQNKNIARYYSYPLANISTNYNIQKAVTKKKTQTSEKIKSTIISCVVSGIEKRVSKNAIQKGITKFGSLEAFKKHYVDREAKKLLKQRMKPEAVQQKLLPKGKSAFTINYDVLARLKLLKKTKKEETTQELVNFQYIPKPPTAYSSKKAYVEDLTRGACLRPDIYLNSGRVCDDCMYSEFCICDVKKFSKKRS